MLRPPRPASILASARRAWRQSLQLRVVTITLVTSGLLMLTFGVLVTSLITGGLVDSKTRSAKNVVAQNTGAVMAQLDSAISTVTDQFARTRLEEALRTGAAADGSYVIAMVPDDARLPPLGPRVDVPDTLRAALHSNGFVSQRLELSVGTEPPKLYLAMGRLLELNWGHVQLYYLFPLDEVVAQANLVGNTIAATGTALVVMLGLVVYFVTRM